METLRSRIEAPLKRQNQRRVVLSKQPGARDRKRLITTSQGIDSRQTQSLYQIASQRPHDELKLLIIRSLGGIGDILMTTPAVRQIKQDFPNALITYATDRHSTKEDAYYQLLKNAPFITDIIDARRMNKSEYNAYVDITSVCIRYENGNLPPLNRIDIFSRACGIPKLKNPVPFYYVEEKERQEAEKQLRPYRDQNLVFLHTASFDNKRCWPVHRYSELIQLAKEQRPDIRFLISDFNNVIPNRKTFTNCLDVTNGSIRGLAATIQASDLFVGPDSGPMHLAGTLAVPSLALFGAIPPQARINYYTNTKAITAPHFVCGGPCFYAKCDFNTRCMSDITAERVLSEITKKLD